MTFARGFEAEAVTEVNPRAMIDECLATYGPHGVTATPAAVAAPFKGRPEALRRAFANLIENAVRYGAAPIEIAIEPADERVRFGVRDHGPGVAEDKLAQLADPFFRGDAARQPAPDGLPSSGTGLGLAIAERVARLHGGRLVLANRTDGFEAVLELTV
jgi:two-component system osmolarity sensor histidine kinase EnvZ